MLLGKGEREGHAGSGSISPAAPAPVSSLPAPPAKLRRESRFRRIAYLLHLWVGLTLGLLASLLGLSGSLLVFRHEIDAALAPELRRVEPGPARATLEEVAGRVRVAYPHTDITAFFMPRGPAESIEVRMKEGSLRVYVDPYRGSILGSHKEEQTLTGWLFHLHSKFLSGERGETFVGWTGFGLLLLSITGVVVWWPRKRQKVADHLRVKWSAGTVRRYYDLHRAAGFYAAGFLALSALTGTALVFPDAYLSALSRLSGRASAAPAPAVRTVNAPRLPLDRLVERAREAAPGGRLSRISFPASNSAPLIVRFQAAGDLHPNGLDYVYLHPATGEVLRVTRSAEARGAQRWMNLRYPYHIGLWAGWASRILLVLVGLTPGLLFFTGVYLWGRRKLKQGRAPSSARR